MDFMYWNASVEILFAAEVFGGSRARARIAFVTNTDSSGFGALEM